MKAYRKIVNRNKIYKEYTNILNSLLGLSGKELEVFSLLLQINAEQKPLLGKKQDILSTDNRKLIMGETNINKNNLSKYIAILKDRGIIGQDEKGHYINNMFIPDIKDKILETLFVLELDETETV